MTTGFNAQAYLSRELYEAITDVRVRQPAFADGSSLEKQGQQALASGQIVPAARYFLEACIRFDRAAASSHRP
jgi:hypothetical protein